MRRLLCRTRNNVKKTDRGAKDLFSTSCYYIYYNKRIRESEVLRLADRA